MYIPIFFGFKMKYTIKGNTITIKYINNGKVKTMKLNVNDKIDLDFFNKLQQANPDNQDSMCDLYQRNILKPTKKNVEHLTPLTLTKEIERPKIVKQQELEQRKRELEEDKKNIEQQAESLLKPDVKLKDLKENDDLTDKVNNAEDIPKIKEIIRKYQNIERVENMIINELNSMEIKTANTVTISELKNLTVNAYENINKTIMETKLNNEDKTELADEIANKIRPNIDHLKKSFGNTIGKVIALIRENKTDIDDIQDTLKELNQNISDLLEKLPQNDDAVEDVQKELSEIQQNDDPKEIVNKLEQIEKKLDKLPNVFNDKTITKNELSLNELLKQFDRNTNFLNTCVGELLLKIFKSNIPILDTLPQTPTDFVKKFVVNWSDTFGKSESTRNTTLKTNLTNIIFIYNNSIYSTKQIDIFNKIKAKTIYIKNASNIEFTESSENYIWGLYKYPYENINQIKFNDILDFIYINEPYSNKIIVSSKPTLYLRYNDSKVENKKYNTTIYTKYFKFIEGPENDTKIMKILSNGYFKEQKPKDDDDSMDFSEFDDASNEESEGLYNGKLDLETASLDDKLNEIIQLLSRMNYNVFTTTPMYKESRNKYSKAPNTKKTNKNQYTDSKSKGIKTDLLTELGLK